MSSDVKKYYRLFPMNMDVYNIDDAVNEVKADKAIIWKNGTTNGMYAQEFNKGDIVYLYCRNLSDGSSRILFRAEVVDADDKDNDIFSYDSKEKIKAVWVNRLKAFNLKDKEKYSKKELFEKYDLNINQTKQKIVSFDEFDEYINDPDTFCNGLKDKEIKHLELIRDLEADYNKAKNENKLYTLIETRDAFNDDILCECCKILDFSNKFAKSRTFKKTNGFIYYEIHHLLMQNILSKTKDDWFNENTWFERDNKNDSEMINAEFNKINLCPVCHREFHYGDFIYDSSNIKDKKELIEKIMELHNYDKFLKEYGKSSSQIKEIKKYIIDQYVEKS